jgi:hypothetical protein
MSLAKKKIVIIPIISSPSLVKMSLEGNFFKLGYGCDFVNSPGKVEISRKSKGDINSDKPGI